MGWRDMTDSILKRCVSTFRTEATYTPAGGSALAISGVYDRPYQALDPESGAQVMSTRPTLGIRLADLPQAPGEGDRLTIGDEAFRVVLSEPDGQGGARLTLSLEA